MADLVTPKGYTMAPLAGKPDDLAGEVTRMKNVASTIEKLTGMLAAIHDKRSCQSANVDKIRDTAGEAGKALAKAKEIYNNTGWALGDYQAQLAISVPNARSAYDSASALLPRLNQAEGAYSTAKTAQTSAQNAPAGTTPEEQTQQQQKVTTANTAASTAYGTLHTLQTEMDGYKKAWDTAKTDLDSAAGTARSRIRTAVDKNPSKDSWWDDFTGFLDALSSILGWVGLVLVIVALFVTGPIAGAILLVATAIAAVKLLADAALYFSGKRTLLDIGFDVLALIPFGSMLGKGMSASERLSAGADSFLSTFKPSTWADAAGALRGPGALQDALKLSTLSRKGNVLAGLVRQVGKADASAPAWYNVFAALKAGGSGYDAQAAHYIAELGGKGNAFSRAAWKELADGEFKYGVPTLAKGIGLGGQDVLGTGYSIYGSSTGSDWTVNQIVGLFSDGPSASELKNRILSPDMLVPPAPLPDPYPVGK